jgi:type I restriction-modification system DNA methylase subunit
VYPDHVVAPYTTRSLARSQAGGIVNVADLIRDTFKRGKYQDVILPLTVLRLWSAKTVML